jgi:hypothetical protein
MAQTNPIRKPPADIDTGRFFFGSSSGFILSAEHDRSVPRPAWRKANNRFAPTAPSEIPIMRDDGGITLR